MNLYSLSLPQMRAIYKVKYFNCLKLLYIILYMFYHWAIYAPAAFLRTKSGLSLYSAPSMGSETTLPYALLL